MSISLTPEAIGLIDAYPCAHAIKSHSQVIEQAESLPKLTPVIAPGAPSVAS
jgi:hypothetical protein